MGAQDDARRQLAGADGLELGRADQVADHVGKHGAAAQLTQ
jgi:hypothetical protein